ncbi:MAG: hypothetical protein ACRDRJ_46090 [Streptosporangiaceae bacterium]
MNIHDELSDNEVLRAASGSLSALPVASPPDVESVMSRGRARRTRRLSAAAGLSVAAGTALVLGLTGVLGSAPASSQGTIRTAAFTLASNSNGTATLTINPKELLDPAALQSDLEQYGIPAKVTTGSLCSSDPAPTGFSQVVSSDPAGPSTSTPQSGEQPAITINPAAMPAGTELSVGAFQLSAGTYAGEQQADFVLINTSSYTCTSTAPDPNGLPDGYGPADGIGLLYGGPGPAGS